MRSRFLAASAAASAGAVLAIASGAQAHVLVIDTPAAAHCSLAAGALERDDKAIATCTDAIVLDALQGRDLAGTYTNRGVLRLRTGATEAAMQDFDMALAIDEFLGEAWIDRAAALLQQSRYQEAIGNADRGLPLTRRGREMGYYIRAIARESLKDDRGAYRDFVSASRVAPAWEAPRVDIARFEVRPR